MYDYLCSRSQYVVLFTALQKLASGDVKEVKSEATGALWELREHIPKTVANTTKTKDNAGVCVRVRNELLNHSDILCALL